jgi:hypothetical protein
MQKAMLTAVALGCAIGAQATVYHFSSFMTSGQEVPPPNSPAYGSSGFSIDSATGRLFGSFTAINLVNGPTSIVDYHIHQAAFGVSGPVRIWNNQPTNTIFTSTSGPNTLWTASFDMLMVQRNGTSGVLFNFDGDGETGVDFDDLNTMLGFLLAGTTYTNVHTTFTPSGEIRGQVAQSPVPEPATVAILGLGTVALLRRRRK